MFHGYACPFKGPLKVKGHDRRIREISTYQNFHFRLPVKTRQETLFYKLICIKASDSVAGGEQNSRQSTLKHSWTAGAEN